MIVRRETASPNSSESAANRPATQDADAGRRDTRQRPLARASQAARGALRVGQAKPVGTMGVSSHDCGPVVSSSGRAAPFGRGAQ